jgi:hypothetical protein
MTFTHHDKKFWKELNYTLSFIIKVLLFNNTELRTLVVMVTSTKSLSYIIRGATALTNLGRLSSRRWQSFPKSLSYCVKQWVQLHDYKLRCHGLFQWHDLPTQFHKTPSTG